MSASLIQLAEKKKVEELILDYVLENHLKEVIQAFAIAKGSDFFESFRRAIPDGRILSATIQSVVAQNQVQYFHQIIKMLLKMNEGQGSPVKFFFLMATLKLQALIHDVSQAFQYAVIFPKLNKYFPIGDLPRHLTTFPIDRQKMVSRHNMACRRIIRNIVLSQPDERNRLIETTMKKYDHRCRREHLQYLLADFLEKFGASLPESILQQVVNEGHSSQIAHYMLESPTSLLDTLIAKCFEGPLSEEMLLSILHSVWNDSQHSSYETESQTYSLLRRHCLSDEDTCQVNLSQLYCTKQCTTSMTQLSEVSSLNSKGTSDALADCIPATKNKSSTDQTKRLDVKSSENEYSSQLDVSMDCLVDKSNTDQTKRLDVISSENEYCSQLDVSMDCLVDKSNTDHVTKRLDVISSENEYCSPLDVSMDCLVDKSNTDQTKRLDVISSEDEYSSQLDVSMECLVGLSSTLSSSPNIVTQDCDLPDCTDLSDSVNIIIPTPSKAYNEESASSEDSQASSGSSESIALLQGCHKGASSINTDTSDVIFLKSEHRVPVKQVSTRMLYSQQLSNFRRTKLKRKSDGQHLSATSKDVANRSNHRVTYLNLTSSLRDSKTAFTQEQSISKHLLKSKSGTKFDHCNNWEVLSDSDMSDDISLNENKKSKNQTGPDIIRSCIRKRCSTKMCRKQRNRKNCVDSKNYSNRKHADDSNGTMECSNVEINTEHSLYISHRKEKNLTQRKSKSCYNNNLDTEVADLAVMQYYELSTQRGKKRHRDNAQKCFSGHTVLKRSRQSEGKLLFIDEPEGSFTDIKSSRCGGMNTNEDDFSWRPPQFSPELTSTQAKKAIPSTAAVSSLQGFSTMLVTQECTNMKQTATESSYCGSPDFNELYSYTSSQHADTEELLNELIPSSAAEDSDENRMEFLPGLAGLHSRS